jgi:hypothetical protein
MPDYTQGTVPTVPAGEYNFVVKNAKEKESKAHNVMIELQLQIENGPLVFDNLVFLESTFWKIDEFRRATGEKLEAGVTASFEAEDCIGRSGKAEFEVDIYDGRSRNKVVRYLESVVPPTVNSNGEPTDIPF